MSKWNKVGGLKLLICQTVKNDKDLTQSDPIDDRWLGTAQYILSPVDYNIESAWPDRYRPLTMISNWVTEDLKYK